MESVRDQVLRQLDEMRGEPHLTEVRDVVLDLLGDPGECTYQVCEEYRKIARALVRKFGDSELRDAKNEVERILFLANTTDLPKRSGAPRIATIAKLPGRFSDILYQLTGRWFSYMMTIYKAWLVGTEPQALAYVIYHELRHLDGLGGLRNHDIEDWHEMHSRLGPNWHRLEQLPDLLAEGVDWGALTVPVLLPDPLDREVIVEDSRGGKAKVSLMELREFADRATGKRK